MYGLINKAIQAMVCRQFGEETWQKVRDKADVEIENFIGMDAYPDDMTHRLVKAASEVLALSPSEIMQVFGKFWIQYTTEEGYGDFMEMSGDTFPDFLKNVDDLHTRVGVVFPKLKPPSFVCTETKETADTEDQKKVMHLQYHSQREGLAPMVLGLVQGVGDKLNTDVEITQTQCKSKGAAHDEFEIQYKSNETF